MRSSRGAHAPEIEAEGRQASLLGHFGRTNHDGVVHVPSVERMGVAEHEPRGRAGLGGEAGLQRGPSRHLQRHGDSTPIRGGEYIRARTRRKQRVYFDRCAASAVCGIALASRRSRMARSHLAVRRALRVISRAARPAAMPWSTWWPCVRAAADAPAAPEPDWAGFWPGVPGAHRDRGRAAAAERLLVAALLEAGLGPSADGDSAAVLVAVLALASPSGRPMKASSSPPRRSVMVQDVGTTGSRRQRDGLLRSRSRPDEASP